MRILLISASYAPVLGGLQTVVRELAIRLQGLGHDVRIVTARYPRSLPKREVMDGIQIDRVLFLSPGIDQLKTGRFDLFLASLWIGPATRLRLFQLAKEFQPDVINVHFPLAANRFVLWLRTRIRFPLVVSLHGNEIMTWYGANLRPFNGVTHVERGFHQSDRGRSLSQMLKTADRVTACSAWLLAKAAGLEKSVTGKGLAIHNGVDPARFSDKTCAGRERPYIFAFGRLTVLKGFDLLVSAFAQIAVEFPETDLVIGGDGEDREALRGLIEQTGLRLRVLLAGRLEPPDVVKYLNGCNFLVVPSRCKPFGIVAIEGLAAGKEVLAADTGGLREIAGLTLVPATEDGLRGGMAALLRNSPTPSRIGTPLTNMDAYNWEQAMEMWTTVLESEVSKNRS